MSDFADIVLQESEKAAASADEAEAYATEARSFIEKTKIETTRVKAREFGSDEEASQAWESAARAWEQAETQIGNLAKRATEQHQDVVAAAKRAREAAEKVCPQLDYSSALESMSRAEHAKRTTDERKTYARAEVAVAKLQVEKFIAAHEAEIYKKLEEIDSIAVNAFHNRDIMFITESLPIVNGIIHFGSSRMTLENAANWVKTRWGTQVDPLVVLSALMFVYIGERGFHSPKIQEDPSRLEIWDRIQQRVQRLL